MRKSRIFSSLILGKFLVLFSLLQASVAQERALHFLDLPDELREMPLTRDRILNDINQDGLLDLLFIKKGNLYLSYQNINGSFSGFDIFNISLQGAVDFADIVSGGEKEICVMHEQGISCFQKVNGRWGATPIPLVEMPTIYKGRAVPGLTLEHFAIDLDSDGIPEIILWGREAYCFYRRDNSGSYRLNQIFPLEARTYLKFPGLKVFRSPFAWLVGGDNSYLYHKDLSLSVRYLNWVKESVSRDFLIGDLNHDSKKDFAWIRAKEIKSPSKGISTVYEYQVHFFDKDKIFSSEPGRVIHDPHGAWLSSMCMDINGDGSLDFLKYHIKTEGSLFQRPSIRIELFLATENGEYPDNPLQRLETSDVPLAAGMLEDVNGDGFKDLVLVHSETKGFSLGSIIRKYVERSLNIEVRILPFQPRQGFSRLEMIRKKVDVTFVAGFPVSLAGDFNGDGLKDMLLLRGDRLKIYLLLEGKTSFSSRPLKDIKIPPHGMYEVVDLDRDLKSEILLYYPDRIGILRANNLPNM